MSKQLNLFSEEELRIKELAKEEVEEIDEYKAFTEKFERKKTTDDCYTPKETYDAVLEWLGTKVNLKGREIIRPFFPDKDYKKEYYPKGCVVVDNPPFSILSEINTFYKLRGIDFFLYAPELTMFSRKEKNITYIITGETMDFENGAKIAVGFCSNMFGDLKIWCCPELSGIIKKVQDRRKETKILPIYKYPKNVVHSAGLRRIAKYAELKIYNDQCYRISKLIQQKKMGKEIYGSGYLISDSAAQKVQEAAQEAAQEAIRFELYPSEKEIIRKLR